MYYYTYSGRENGLILKLCISSQFLTVTTSNISGAGGEYLVAAETTTSKGCFVMIASSAILEFPFLHVQQEHFMHFNPLSLPHNTSHGKQWQFGLG